VTVTFATRVVDEVRKLEGRLHFWSDIAAQWGKGVFLGRFIVWMSRVVDGGDQFDMEVCHHAGEDGWTGHPTNLTLG
jgi:hypothetical protein